MAMTSLWLSDQVDKTLPPNPLNATNRPADVVVVGAGITGLVTAVLLAAAGRDVLVPDAHTAGADANVNNSSKTQPLLGRKLSRIVAKARMPTFASSAPAI